MADNKRIELVDKRRIKSVDDTCDEPGEPDLARIPFVVDRLKEEKEKSDSLLKEYIAAHKEKMAEIDELRTRLEADVDNRATSRFGEMLKGLLPLIDDFDRAIDHAKKTNPDDPMLAGVTMLREGLFTLLTKEGLEIIDCAGKPFDPELAQAVGTQIVDDDKLDNVVIEQVAPGFSFGGLVLRPAMVRVGQKG